MTEEQVLQRIQDVDREGQPREARDIASLLQTMWDDISGRKGVLDDVDEDVRATILADWCLHAYIASGQKVFEEIYDAAA